MFTIQDFHVLNITENDLQQIECRPRGPHCVRARSGQTVGRQRLPARVETGTEDVARRLLALVGNDQLRQVFALQPLLSLR